MEKLLFFKVIYEKYMTLIIYMNIIYIEIIYKEIYDHNIWP